MSLPVWIKAIEQDLVGPEVWVPWADAEILCSETVEPLVIALSLNDTKQAVLNSLCPERNDERLDDLAFDLGILWLKFEARVLYLEQVLARAGTLALTANATNPPWETWSGLLNELEGAGDRTRAQVGDEMVRLFEPAVRYAREQLESSPRGESACNRL